MRDENLQASEPDQSEPDGEIHMLAPLLGDPARADDDRKSEQYRGEDMSERQARYGKEAPDAEAALAAKDMRKTLFEALECAMDNEWELVSNHLEVALALVRHCQTHEGMGRR